MKTIYKVLIGIALFIVVFTIYQSCDTDYILKDTTTTTSVDTTKIDSLQQQVSYWRDIAQSKQDTIRDTVRVTEYVQVNDSTREYTSTYQDSSISATWNTSVVGLLKNQVFEYTLKQERVVEKTNTVTITETKTITKTERYVQEPDPYFSIGAFGGTDGVGPSLSYTTSDQYRLSYRYNALNGAHMIGVEMPLKFEFNLF